MIGTSISERISQISAADERQRSNGFGADMASFGTGDIERGSVEIVEHSATEVRVIMTPSETALRSFDPSGKSPVAPVCIISIDSTVQRATIFPIDTHPVVDLFFKPKYGQIRSFSVPYSDDLPTDHNGLDIFLDSLPRGFTKDYQYGLGLPRQYRSLIDAVESQTACTHIDFTYDEEASVDGLRLNIPLSSFEEARAEIDRIIGRSNTASFNVRKAASHNWVATQLGSEAVDYKRGRHPMVKAFADAAADDRKLRDEDIDDLIDVVFNETLKLRNARPEALAKLREDIELLELDALIERYEEMLAKDLTENKWQEFFETNPFILSFAFGYPLILTQGQASVGGRKLSGGGGKIADFLVKNPSTNNVALFEIKRPSTELLQKSEYRGDLYAPSSELSGSVLQVLDQRQHLVEEFPQIMRNSRTYDIESFAVRLCLIIGRVPDTPQKIKSFELFRANSHDVEIVMFDELLDRVRLLRTFVSGANQNDTARTEPS
jgi:hypothetical protein